MIFTQRKFQSLPLEQQHKKCSELLRQLYQRQLEQDTLSPLELEHYLQLRAWMNLPLTSNFHLNTLADLYHFHLHLANVHLKEHRLLPHVMQNDRVESAPIFPIAIYLDRLRSSHNVGSIFRTVEALALGTIYCSETTPFNHKGVQDTSMGAWQWVNAYQGVPLSQLPRPLLALETVEGAKSLASYPFPQSFTLIVGNEEEGCSEQTLLQADDFISIPLAGRKNSLNVANAFAMAAYEIARQRGRF